MHISETSWSFAFKFYLKQYLCLGKGYIHFGFLAVIQAVLRFLPIQPSVERFVVDFEAGLWQGRRSVFDKPDIKGCAFHWGQAVWRRQVQQLGHQVHDI